MAGYIKRIALIKTLKAGYSSDGGSLKGVVRCEAYAGYFKAEASLINFAPFAEGHFRVGLTDGSASVIFDPPLFEGDCPLNPRDGFACLVAFCRDGSVLPVASAVCGDNQHLLASLQRAMEDEESVRPAYDDEAIADSNYYEYEHNKDGGSICRDKAAETGQDSRADEDDTCAVQGGAEPSTGADGQPHDGTDIKYPSSYFRISGTPHGAEDGQLPNAEEPPHEAPPVEDTAPDEAAPPRLAGGGFFERMSGDIKNIFSTYPRLGALEDVIEDSKWVKISYGSGAHYAFGVIYYGGKARYICYGVPVAEQSPCPESLQGRASYIPVEGGGYWVMYQDAATGISVAIECK